MVWLNYYPHLPLLERWSPAKSMGTAFTAETTAHGLI
jgi:hypothetical protein